MADVDGKNSKLSLQIDDNEFDTSFPPTYRVNFSKPCYFFICYQRVQYEFPVLHFPADYVILLSKTSGRWSEFETNINT